MADRRTANSGLLAIAAVVAALSACNPLTQPVGSSRAPTKPVLRPISRPTTRPHPTPTAAPTVTPTPTPAPSGSVSDAYEARILVLVNAERTSRGLSPLTASSCADGYAESWAPVIQRNGALSHQSLGPILTTCHASTAGENVAYGNVTADEMMTMWMNSAGHRANILNPGFTAIGIAAVTDSSGRWYGVQDFIG